ncbi:DUF4388 domain-containing protein [Arthrospira platensis SPKY1]|nr:DUF4388 domain-containing protein [Arthrospira platensis SPKY1]
MPFVTTKLAGQAFSPPAGVNGYLAGSGRNRFVKSMALKGNLRDFPTTQILNLINLARKTGTLTIQGQDVASMAFREGKLIDASLANEGGNLARMLQRSGKLSAEQVRIIETRAAGIGDKQLGHLLVRAGHVTQSDIIQSVRHYVLEIAYSLFAWAEGFFRFDADQLPANSRITIPIDLENVILEGSRRLKEQAVLQREIPSLDATLRFSEQRQARAQQINLTPAEWRVAAQIGPQRSLRQIAQTNNLDEFEIRRIVYGMLQVGFVEFTPSPQAAARPNGAARRAATVSPPLPAAAPQESGAARRSIVMRLIDRIRGL